MSTTAGLCYLPYTGRMSAGSLRGVLDLWSLQILVAVAARGSFSAAAGDLVLTQPAVSRQVANLERELGVPLFRRQARGVALTTAGETAVEHARGVLDRIDAFQATMRTLAGLDGGHLRIAGFPSVNTHFVPDAIRHFDLEHPAVTITLEQVDPFAVTAAVRDGRIDVALVSAWQLVADPWTARTDPRTGALDPDAIDGVDLHVLMDEELRVALPADHRLARRRRLPLAELRGERWVDGAPPDCLGPLPQLADALGAPPDIGFMCDDWNGKQALVAAGAGIMVVPTLAGAAIRPDLVLRPTTPALPTRRLYAATAQPPFRTPPAETMLTVLATLAADRA